MRAVKNLKRQRLEELMDGMLEDGCTPETWRKNLVTYKSKRDKNSRAAYRPICVTSTVYRIFMHIIKQRPERQTVDKRILENLQLGFRAGRQTENNLSASKLPLWRRERSVGLLFGYQKCI